VGLLLCARRAGEISISCCTAGALHEQQRRRSTALSSEGGQCHVDG